MSYRVTARMSPNRSARIGAPRYLVCHVTQGSFDGSVSWLCNPAAEASADEVISLDGKRVAVLNWIRQRLKCWAVGNANSLCVNFENEGFAGKTHWPDAHYDTLAARMIAAQAAVKRTYGRTIPLVRTTTKGRAGICGHGDVARWYGGSDHFGCPGPTFDYGKLHAAITARIHPAETTSASSYSRRQAWHWAKWYLGVAEYRGHGRREWKAAQERLKKAAPPPHPRKIPAAWYGIVRWLKRHNVK